MGFKRAKILNILNWLPVWRKGVARGIKKDGPYKGRTYLVYYTDILKWRLVTDVRYEDEQPGEFV